MSALESVPIIINHVIGKGISTSMPVASTNPNKLEEYRKAGLDVVPGREVPEKQDENPYIVVSLKAIDAFWENGGLPTLVDDTSFETDAKEGQPGPFAKHDLGTLPKRQRFCREIHTLYPNNTGATFHVLLAVYDGTEVHIREGATRGTIAEEPKGDPTFGFDDIFIANGEERTYGEMPLPEKNRTSARARAVKAMVDDPILIGERVFQLPEPYQEQVDLVLKEELVDDPRALQFAFGLDVLSPTTPNAELRVDEIAPLYRIEHGDGKVIEYTVNRDSAGQGLVLYPSIDTKTVLTWSQGQRPRRVPRRLEVWLGERPLLMQMGKKAMELALAARAREYKLMHSDKVHEIIRDLKSKGEEGRAKRTNKRSFVLEELLGMSVNTVNGSSGEQHIILKNARKVIAPSEIGYVRKSSERNVSRKKAARYGLLSMQNGLPTMPIALGGMPPTTGSVDTAVTAAMSYMRSWVPHNGIFAGDYARQLKFFRQAKAKIDKIGLDPDIAEVCIQQIGLSVGTENPEEIAEQARQFKALGGRAIRIYTTNPGIGVQETARAIREAVGSDFTICVGPITDVEQARRLIKDADVNMFIVGHGAGENCTSLEGGGAANAIPLLYEMNLDPLFNDRVLGIEGGVGTAYGPLLPLVDFFSLNGKVVGGIEPTGGVYLKHRSGIPVLPYHGSASVVTQKIEAAMNMIIRKKRLGEDGMVESVEGKPNYRPFADWARSMVSFFQATRAYIGLAFADMDSKDIFEFRAHVEAEGYNIVGVSTEAQAAAHEHRKLR